MTRTLAFVIAASLSVLGAVATYYATRPAAVAGYDLVGQEFYPNFRDPNEATAIRIAAFNDKSNKVEEFEVRYSDGQWRIPSHYNYPADASDRLARAAASAVGITRGPKVSDGADAYERLGVVDPDDSAAVQSRETTGTRITLYKGEEVLADYIIGKRPGADDEEAAASDDDETSGRTEKEGIYYVRLPGERQQVYRAEVNIDVSTRFADWIKTQLLDFGDSSLREIVAKSYSVEEKLQPGPIQGLEVKSLEVKEGSESRLERESSSAPWVLVGLDAAREKLKPGVVSAMERALKGLKIVGVRPKPVGLNEALRAGHGKLRAPGRTVDLGNGFVALSSGEVLSREGDVLAGTSDGVLYTLRFGEVFTGSDLEIEVGGKPSETPATDAQAGAAPEGSETAAPADTEGSAAAPATGESKDLAAADPAKAEETSEDAPAGAKSSRFVFITAEFDPNLLGPAPVEPTKPTPPPADAPADKPAEPAANPPAEAPAAAATPPAAPAADAAAPMVEPEAKPKTPQQVYEEALQTYETEMEAYEARKADYDQRLADGRKRAEELNNRFSDWYYVIPADVFEDLRVTREQLVEPVEPPAQTPPDDPPATAPMTPEGTAPADAPAAPANSASPSPENPGPTTPPMQTPPAAPAGTTPASGTTENPSSTPSPAPAPAGEETPAAGESPAPSTPQPPAEAGTPPQ